MMVPAFEGPAIFGIRGSGRTLIGGKAKGN